MIFFIIIFIFILGTNSIYEIIYLVGIVCVIVMMIIAKYMPKRNIYGDNMYNKMEGFRKLLEEGEKEEYINVLNTNNNYYYDIIAYTYILKNRSIVCKRFKKYIDKGCEWFKTYKEFIFESFNKVCDGIYEVLRENN